MSLMEQALDFFHTYMAHPLVMIGAIVLLLAYRHFSKRTYHLPEFPMGLFMLYFAIRFIWLLVKDASWVGAWDRWIPVAEMIVLSWAMIRLIFALFVDHILKLFGKQPLPKITRDFILLLVYAVVGFILLRTKGEVNLTGLLTTSAVLTAVIGLAAQSTLTNLFSGLTLQMERPYNIGDWIQLGDTIGQGVGITWKSTRLIAREDEMIFIPNMTISQSIIKNFSKPSTRHNASLLIGIDYNIAPNKVREMMLEVVKQHPLVLHFPPPEVRVKEFGDSAVLYQIIFAHDHYAEEPRIKTEINHQLWYALKRHQIKIPFPIRDVHHAHIERRRQEKEAVHFREEAEKILSSIPLFTALSDDDRKQIAETIFLKEFGDHEIIVRQGEEGDSLYIIHNGACNVFLGSNGKEPKKIATMHEGHFFGEMSLLTGEPRSATVRAHRDTSVFEIKKEALKHLLEKNPTLSMKLAEALAARKMELSEERGKITADEATKGKLLSKIKNFFGLHA